MEMVPFHIWSTEPYHNAYNMLLNHHQLNYSKGFDLLLVQYNSKSERKQKINMHDQYNYNYNMTSCIACYIGTYICRVVRDVSRTFMMGFPSVIIRNYRNIIIAIT